MRGSMVDGVALKSKQIMSPEIAIIENQFKIMLLRKVLKKRQ